MRRIFKSLLMTVGAFFLGAILCIGILAVKLSSGNPISFAFLKSSLIDRYLPLDHKLDFQELTLTYDQKTNTMRIDAHSLSYTSKDSQAVPSTLARGTFIFPLRTLVKLHPIPESIILDGLNIFMAPPHSSRSQGTAFSLDHMLDQLNEHLETLVNLKEITLTDSRLLIPGAALRLSAQLHQTSTGLEGDVSLHNPTTTASVLNTMFYHSPSQTVTLTTKCTDIGQGEMAFVVPPEIFKTVTIATLALEASYTYSLKTKKPQGNLTFTLQGINLQDQTLWEAPLQIPTLTLTGRLAANTFQIAPIDFHLPPSIPVSASLEGTIHDGSPILETTLKVDVGDIPFKLLHILWPKGAADGARDWITTNITDGLASDSTMTLKSQWDFSSPKDPFHLKHLSGSIRVNNAVLGYVETMPKITNLNALAAFDHDHFDITVMGGTTQDLTLQKGKVMIGQFSAPVSTLSIDLPIKGKLQDMLTLIDYEPLQYAKAFGIKPGNAGGTGIAQFHISFPLTSPFQTSAIETTVKATLANVIVKSIVDLPLTLTQGALSVDVGPEDVTIQGKAFLNNEKASIQLTQKFEPATLDLAVTTVVTPLSLKPLWENCGVFFQGSAPLDLTYQVANNKGKLHLKADLKKTVLNTLLMHKADGVASTLEGTMMVPNEGPISLEKINYTDHNKWHMTGKASFQESPTGALVKSIDSTWTHDKKEVLKATYARPAKGIPTLKLAGKNLDLKNYMDTDLSSLMPTQPSATSDPLRLQLTANKLTFGPPLGFLNNALDLTMDRGLIQTLTYTGVTEEGSVANRQIRASISQKPKGVRKLIIQTQQGGEFLRALDIFSNIRGGNFQLVAFHDPAFHPEDWIGKIRVRQFALLKAPLVTRIFSLFPTAGTELTSDSGMTLTLLKMRFAASSRFFKIHACRAHGISVGFNLAGTIDRAPQGPLSIQGAMIPLYIFNTLVSKIPFIGETISGGKNQGIFNVSFGITGTKENPDVTANPLSLMTPGLTRNFFPAGDEKIGRDDGWLDDEDKPGDIFDQEFAH